MVKKHNELKNRLSRKDACTMDELISIYIREMKLTAGLNRQRIFAAWDEVSGAAAYTVDRYLKNNVLYCAISSSVVRNRLYFQQDVILRNINEFLQKDDLFVKDQGKTVFLKGIVLR